MDKHYVSDLYTDEMFKEMNSWTKLVKRVQITTGEMDKDARRKIYATIEWSKPNLDLQKMFEKGGIVPPYHYVMTIHNGNIIIYRTVSYAEAQNCFLMAIGELAEGEP